MTDRGSRPAPGFLLLGAVALMAIAWLVVARTPIFQVRHIRVVGTERLEPAEIARLSGLDGRDNLLFLSSESVADGLLSDPRIASATVRRDFPGTVVISVRERAPIAWVAQPAGGATLSADGVVLEVVERKPDRLVGLGALEEPAAPGERVRSFDPSLAAVASLPPWVRRQVAEAVTTGEAVTLQLRDGGRVLLGAAESLEAKAAALRSILRWAQTTGLTLEQVDLAVPRAPAVLKAA